jgi:adenosylmethionine---8-amino-7-oxononanoate aminotransferase
VAVEVAIKLALQYWQACGRPNKHKLLTVRSGYHGDTFLAMSVCDPVTGMHGLFRDVLPKQYFAEAPACAYAEPWQEHFIEDFTRKLVDHHAHIAAVVLEPIVQGTGGMRFYSPVYLQRVRALCDAYDVLLIADEIATGFGRTGRMFGVEHSQISPDIMCLGKALTGGYMTLAATLCTDAVSTTIDSAPPHAFMHGPTFMANPLACAIACASIELLTSSSWQHKVGCIEAQLRTELARCASLPQVREVRTLGAIGVVELHEPVDMRVVQPAFVERGVWIRPFGKLVYTMPPYIIDPAGLSQITNAIWDVVAHRCT